MWLMKSQYNRRIEGCKESVFVPTINIISVLFLFCFRELLLGAFSTVVASMLLIPMTLI
jgi:hypothetical protein